MLLPFPTQSHTIPFIIVHSYPPLLVCAWLISEMYLTLIKIRDLPWTAVCFPANVKQQEK